MSENKTTNFKSTSRIVEATSSDSTRPQLTCVEVRRKNEGQVYLTATNGHVLAVRIEQGETSETALVPQDVFSKRKAEDTINYNNERWENIGMGKFGRNGDDSVRYPDVKQILPDNIEGYQVISFNADELYHLARALKDKNAMDNGVVLLVPEDRSKPICVLPSLGAESFGLLMPMRIEGSEADFNKLVREYKAILKGDSK